MSRAVVVTSKFLGVAGLGLLSSSALTLAFGALPSFLAVPTLSDALPAVHKLKQHVAAAHRLLAVSTGTLLASAFLLSPRYARHPFLIYMGISVGVGMFGVPRAVKSQDVNSLDEIQVAEEGRGRTGASMHINGEIVREHIESWSRLLKWQSVAWGLGWAMGTVGLWGDGY